MEKETKRCPYCGEEILAVAKKCKHCKQWIDEDHQGVTTTPTQHNSNTQSTQDVQPEESGEPENYEASATRKGFFSFLAVVVVISVFWMIANPANCSGENNSSASGSAYADSTDYTEEASPESTWATETEAPATESDYSSSSADDGW